MGKTENHKNDSDVPLMTGNEIIIFLVDNYQNPDYIKLFINPNIIIYLYLLKILMILFYIV